MITARVVSIVSILALAGLMVSSVQQRPGPGLRKVALGLPGGVPATLYYQDTADAPADARPGIERLAASSQFRAGVVVAHGFSGDRHTMEGLSQSLARAGYTVVSLDMSGHGRNRNPLVSALAASDQLVGDIRAGVEFLRNNQAIEPARIVALGHSMGARAALDYGSHQADVGGLIMLAGATDMLGPDPPRNALFLYAERDLPGIPRSVTTVAARLAHVDTIEERRTYGDIGEGTAVRVMQIPGVVHGTVIASPIAFAEVINWLDQVTGFPARATTPTLVANPLGSRLAWLAFLLVLPGLGLLLAQLAPAVPPDNVPARARDLALLPIALLLPLPFMIIGRTGVLAGSSTADANVTHLVLAGVLLVVGLRLGSGLRLLNFRRPASLLVAAVGWLAISVLLAPASAHFHGVGLTPERALLAGWSALCLAPLALGMQWLVYRPVWWRGTLLRLASRIIIVATVVAGNALGVFGFPGTIALLVVLSGTAIVEPLLAGFYGRSRNILVAAGIDALISGWLFALFLPTTV